MVEYGAVGEPMNSTSIIALNPNENSMAIVELLVERGLGVNAQDCDGNTPLHLAKYLVSSGADEEIKNWKGISSHKWCSRIPSIS